MLLVNDHPDWSNARIAEEVGKSRSTLSRSKYYREAARLARAPVRTPRRGFHIRHPDERIGLEAESVGGVACRVSRNATRIAAAHLEGFRPGDPRRTTQHACNAACTGEHPAHEDRPP